MYPNVFPMFKPEFTMNSLYSGERFEDDLFLDEDIQEGITDFENSYILQRGEEDFENARDYELNQSERCNIYAAMATRVKDSFTLEEARRIGEMIGIDWETSPFDVEEFRKGMNVELEHGQRDPGTNVTGDNPILTGKIALAHLNEFPDYYERLSKLEKEAKAYWMMP
jgi:hypothetical protein